MFNLICPMCNAAMIQGICFVCTKIVMDAERVPTPEEGRACVERLGIDVPALASDIRAMIDAATRK